MARKKSADTPEQETEKRLKTRWRQLFREGKITRPFEEFYTWHTAQHKKQEGKCCYCGLSEEQAAELFELSPLLAGEPLVKHNRGRNLEIERKAPNKNYDDFDNLALACYWCNNAKTDTFTEQEFKKVGAVFAEIWQARLAGKKL